MVIVAKDANITIERLELGPWDTNAYIIVCLESGKSVLIDAPSDVSTIINGLSGTKPEYILLTHDHPDHTGALQELRLRLGIPLAAHEADSSMLNPPPEVLLKDGDVFFIGKAKLEVLHTPGHTPGSLCFKTDKYLISGDTIFPGGPGKTGSPVEFRQIVKSIFEKILPLPDDTEIYPGHGNPTILKKEREEIENFNSRPHAPNLFGDVLWLSS